MSSNLCSVGEFGLIDKIKKQFDLSSDAFIGIGDDAAVVNSPQGKKILLTTDMLVEGVHFDLKMPPDLVGRKALAVSISDIAAMGGIPKYALVSLGLSGKTALGIVEKMYKGINNVAEKFGVSIVGGDTVKSKATIINIALIGEARKKDIVLRSTARAGDYIYVTGPLGNSFKSKHHLKFIPRIMESQYLIKECKPSAMIDISDGLVQDLFHILKASGLGAILYQEKIPKRKGATLNEALHQGEDFELLFTVSAKKAKRLEDEKSCAVSFYKIGEIIDKKNKAFLIDCRGERKVLRAEGYQHF